MVSRSVRGWDVIPPPILHKDAHDRPVAVMQPPLEKFYDLLSDEQKARLTALANEQRESNAMAKPAGSGQACGTAQPDVMEWPTAEIDRTVQPTDAQRASLVALQDASAKAADMLKASCPTENPLTPPARLAAVGQRLDSILQAVKTVCSALDDFYGMLTDEQKAKFEAIGPQRTSQAEALEVAPQMFAGAALLTLSRSFGV